MSHEGNPNNPYPPEPPAPERTPSKVEQVIIAVDHMTEQGVEVVRRKGFLIPVLDIVVVVHQQLKKRVPGYNKLLRKIRGWW